MVWAKCVNVTSRPRETEKNEWKSKSEQLAGPHLLGTRMMGNYCGRLRAGDPKFSFGLYWPTAQQSCWSGKGCAGEICLEARVDAAGQVKGEEQSWCPPKGTKSKENKGTVLFPLTMPHVYQGKSLQYVKLFQVAFGKEDFIRILRTFSIPSLWVKLLTWLQWTKELFSRLLAGSLRSAGFPLLGSVGVG